MSTITLGTADAGVADATLDPKVLVTSRMLVTANSGGGKSYLLRKVLEQVGRTAQTFVLDLEGEFVTLRETLDLVIVGPGGEIPADVRSAGLLCRRLMEKQLSAVIDLSELRAGERRHFVRLFLETLVELPKSLWRPLFVCLDEAHQFAPEKGQGEAESTGAVRDLCTLGRKRGFCPILATQRISTLDKSCSAECNNKFIGRMTLDNDIKRAAFELGVAATEALKMLRELPRGEFYAFGPALGVNGRPAGVTKVKIGPVETTHPKAGQGQSLTPPKPSKAITSVVSELADLPKQAEAEIKDLAAAKAKIAELQRAVDAKPVPAAAAPAKVETKVVDRPVVTDKQIAAIDGLVGKLDLLLPKAGGLLQQLAERQLAAQAVGDGVSEQIHALQATIASARSLNMTPVDGVISRSVEKRHTALAGHSSRPLADWPDGRLDDGQTFSVPTAASSGTSVIRERTAARMTDGRPLTAAQHRILAAASWWLSVGVETPTRPQVAFVARIKPTGGHFSNSIGPLTSGGLLDNVAGAVRLTAAGRAAAPPPDGKPTLKAYHDGIRAVLATGAQRTLFDAIVSCGGEEITVAYLGETTGINPAGGHFSNSIGPISTLGLITRTQGVVFPTLLMFPEGLR